MRHLLMAAPVHALTTAALKGARSCSGETAEIEPEGGTLSIRALLIGRHHFHRLGIEHLREFIAEHKYGGYISPLLSACLGHGGKITSDGRQT
ncbi:hypothetical protein ACVWXO_000851 [Bradyrhizobium sp. LM2.7]